MEQYKNDLNGLTELLTAGVSPLHTIRHSMNLLESRGFTELSLDKAWALEPGKGYFVNAFDTTLIGFTVGEDAAEHPSFRIASSLPDGKAVSGNLCRGVRKAECGSLRRSDFKHLA